MTFVHRIGKIIKRLTSDIVAQYQHVAVVGSLVLLAINLAMTSYEYMAWRGIHPYIGITVNFVLIMLAIASISYLVVNKFEFYKTMKWAQNVKYNPYGVHQMNPFQEITFYNMHLQNMKALYEIMPEGEKKEELGKTIEKVETWFDGGYIPRDHFPPHLKKYYQTKHEERLG